MWQQLLGPADRSNQEMSHHLEDAAPNLGSPTLVILRITCASKNAPSFRKRKMYTSSLARHLADSSLFSPFMSSVRTNLLQDVLIDDVCQVIDSFRMAGNVKVSLAIEGILGDSFHCQRPASLRSVFFLYNE